MFGFQPGFSDVRRFVSLLLVGGLFGLLLGVGVSWVAAGRFGVDAIVTAQAGIAAALASLGTSGLERMFARIVGGAEK